MFKVLFTVLAIFLSSFSISEAKTDCNIVVVTTGGTIASIYDPVTKGLVPAVSGKELLEAVPQLKDLDCKVVIQKFSQIGSASITPAMMKKLADTVEGILAKKNITGVVITHGTDTIEESAYFLDLVIKSKKPVVLTASMRGAGDLSPDGPKNILDSIKTVASPNSYDKGVMVVINEQIHSAREVTKMHTANIASFASPYWGAIGYVDSDRVIFRREATNRQNINSNKIAEDVYLIKVFSGMNSDIFDFLITKKVKGVVVEGFGRGNIPDTSVDGVKRMIDAGIVVVLTTRVPTGRVLGTYSDPGAGKVLQDMGAILAGEISGQKARIKLMLTLGKTKTKKEIEKYFDYIGK